MDPTIPKVHYLQTALDAFEKLEQLAELGRYETFCIDCDLTVYNANDTEITGLTTASGLLKIWRFPNGLHQFEINYRIQADSDFHYSHIQLNYKGYEITSTRYFLYDIRFINRFRYNNYGMTTLQIGANSKHADIEFEIERLGGDTFGSVTCQTMAPPGEGLIVKRVPVLEEDSESG